MRNKIAHKLDVELSLSDIPKIRTYMINNCPNKLPPMEEVKDEKLKLINYVTFFSLELSLTFAHLGV